MLSNEEISEAEILLADNLNVPVNQLAFKLKMVRPNLRQWVILQAEGREMASEKIPTWGTVKGLRYPGKISLEQCSSEPTAKFKQRFLGENEVWADITGGWGVDSYFMSLKCRKVYHIEQNEELQTTALHNFKLLNAHNIESWAQDGIMFLKNKSENSLDGIYIDPSRRSPDGKKVFRWVDCSPNVAENMDLLFSKAAKLLIKASPMLDIQDALNDIKFVKSVTVLSVDNECKELLFYAEKGFLGEPEMVCTNIKRNTEEEFFSFYWVNERQVQISYNSLQNYLYEPNTSILKAGAFKQVASHWQLTKISPSTHLYTSEHLRSSFQGRAWKVVSSGTYKRLEPILKGIQANIITRNYPLSASELKKKLKVKDGGSQYIIAFKDTANEAKLALCERMY